MGKVSKIKNNGARFFNEIGAGYAWAATNWLSTLDYKDKGSGALMDPKKGEFAKLGYYGPHCKGGDIVEMILDLEQRTLRYKVNDSDNGVAFENIEKTEYKAAIWMYTYGL